MRQHKVTRIIESAGGLVVPGTIPKLGHLIQKGVCDGKSENPSPVPALTAE